MANDMASRLRDAYLDTAGVASGLDRTRARILKHADTRHDAIGAELDAARLRAHADPEADAEVDHFLEERAHCARLGAVEPVPSAPVPSAPVRSAL